MKEVNDLEVIQGDVRSEPLNRNFSYMESIVHRAAIEAGEKEPKNRLFRRKIYRNYPIWFEDYNAILSAEKVSYIYPQSYTIDWASNEIFILYEPSTDGSTKRWVVVRDLDSGEYKSCFHAGNSGGEGIVIKYEGGTRYLYVRTTGTSIGRFNITKLPSNRSTINPTAQYNVGVAFEFCYDETSNLWLIEQANPAYGQSQRRTTFAYYDEGLSTMVGSINIAPEDGGYFVGPYTDFIPKRQAIGLRGTEIIQAVGGNYTTDIKVTPYNYNGLKIMSSNGDLMDEGVVDPTLMINLLKEFGYYADRLEMEGLHVAPNGAVYSLVTHIRSITSSQAKSQGIIIFEEMSNDPLALNFKGLAKSYTSVNKAQLETGSFPRLADSKMYDPYKGHVLDTFDKIMDMMQGIELKQFAFFSNEVSVKDAKGAAIPADTYVIIKNTNNYTFTVSYQGIRTSKDWIVYGPSGSRTQQEVFKQMYRLTTDDGSVIYAYGDTFDSHKSTGYYYKQSTDAGNPITQYGFLQVLASAQTVIQIFHPVVNPNIFKRIFNDGKWTAWQKHEGVSI